MNKRSYLKGLGTGVIITAFVCVAINFGLTSLKSIQSGGMDREVKIDAILSKLSEVYIDPIDEKQVEEGLYRGMVDSLGDPYTTYFTEEEMQAFMEDTRGLFYGVGVYVTAEPETNRILVVDVISGTPAEESGIKPGDYIVKVNGTSVTGDEINTAVRMIKGDIDTPVTLTLQREGQDNFDVTLNRAEVDSPTVTYEMLEGNIGYIKITQFKEKTYEQFMEAYEALNQQGQKGLILDLRNNPGGLFDVATEITDELVPEGTMVYTVDKNGNRVDTASDATEIEVPLCLLVNGGSASATEIMAGAVQDMGVGELVGTQTYGKGLVQGVYMMPDGSGLKITIQKYYTPNGVCIQGEGIAPDYTIDLPDGLLSSLSVEKEEDVQLQKAMEVITQQLGEE